MRVVSLAYMAEVQEDGAARWDPLSQISKGDKKLFRHKRYIILLRHYQQPLSLMRSVAWSSPGENQMISEYKESSSLYDSL